MLNKLFVKKTNNTLIQLFRYTFVGGIAFVVDFVSLYLLTEFAGFHYLYSAAIAFILGLIINYILSILWVFNGRTVNKKIIEIIIFAVIGIIGLGLNELMIWFFTEQLTIYYLYSKLISTVIVYFWNFLARKYILYNKGSVSE
ncbi:MAG: polysaccharide synthesis protein GtrA [Candidatus Cloacimonas sp. 4484_143]|nr:MAG: polysaccharide synthesis protein GtrA [Candidatus Cloacimonas sp. 4484_143]